MGLHGGPPERVLEVVAEPLHVAVPLYLALPGEVVVRAVVHDDGLGGVYLGQSLVKQSGVQSEFL